MSFAQLHKLVVYAVAGLGLSALALGGEIQPVSMAVLAVGYLASWFVEPERVPRAVFFSSTWTIGWVSVLLLLIALAVARWFFGEPPLLLALEISGVLSVSRLMSRRGAAEHQQVVLLSFLHLGAATVLTSSLTWAIPFLGFVTIMPWALALSHLRTEIEVHFAPSEAEGGPLAVPGADAGLDRILKSKRLISGRFLLGTAALSLPMFVVTAVFFLLFPRIGLNFLSGQRADSTPITGFGDEVRLGEVGTLRTDQTVVLRVVPPNLSDDPPRYLGLRLRGSSFDHYDGRAWSRTLTGTARVLSQPRGTHYHVLTRIPDPANDRGYRIALAHLDPSVVFLPEQTIALEIDPATRDALRGFDLGLSPGLDVRYDDTEGLGLRYTAWTPPAGMREFPVGVPTAELQRYLEVPPAHEDVLALGHRWVEGAQTDREVAERILVALRDGELGYSLEMRDPGDRTPLSAFLFVHREGHCEYFASAMAIILRGEGIPSRSVTGFLGGQWNAFGGYYAVHSGDAHAWVEAYLPGEGWVTFDPTPPARNGAVEASGLLLDLREVYDALSAAWDEQIVSWDIQSQRGLFRDAFRWLRRNIRGSATSDGDTPETEADPSEPTAPEETTGGWPWAIALAVLVIAIAMGVLLRRRRGGDGSGPRALLVELDRALSRRGRARPAARTPLEHAAVLAKEGFPEHPEVRVIVERYLGARFGDERVPDDELAALRARARALGRAPGGPSVRVSSPRV